MHGIFLKFSIFHLKNHKVTGYYTSLMDIAKNVILIHIISILSLDLFYEALICSMKP